MVFGFVIEDVIEANNYPTYELSVGSTSMESHQRRYYEWTNWKFMKYNETSNVMLSIVL